MQEKTNAKNIAFNFITNYFLKDGEMPTWMDESSTCLRKAIDYAKEEGIHVIAKIKTNQQDAAYFDEKFADNENLKIEVLPERSSCRRFPYLKDILTGNQELETINTPNNENKYLIYANADICMPKFLFHFILQQIMLHESLRSERPSFVINRKDVVGGAESLIESDNSQIYMHPGYDMFVFHASKLKDLKLGNVAIGTPPIGVVLKLNLINLSPSKKVVTFHKSLLTWHRGRDKDWKSPSMEHERMRNRNAGKIAIKELAESLQISTNELHASGFEELLLREINPTLKTHRLTKRIVKKLKKQSY